METVKQETLLEIDNLNFSFKTQRGLVRAVRDLSITIKKGETLTLVGESGCGKSVTAHSINQLNPMPPGRVDSGRILFNGTDLLQLKKGGNREDAGYADLNDLSGTDDRSEPRVHRRISDCRCVHDTSGDEQG